jgi:DnaJ-class molecular chaperone
MNSEPVTCRWCEGFGSILVDRRDDGVLIKDVEECVGCRGSGEIDPSEKEEEEK